MSSTEPRKLVVTPVNTVSDAKSVRNNTSNIDRVIVLNDGSFLSEQQIASNISQNGGVLVGSRFFGLETPDSDYDFVMDYFGHRNKVVSLIKSYGFKSEDNISSGYGLHDPTCWNEGVVIYNLNDRFHLIIPQTKNLFYDYVNFAAFFKKRIITATFKKMWFRMREQLSDDDFRQFKRLIDTTAFKAFTSGKPMCLGEIFN